MNKRTTFVCSDRVQEAELRISSNTCEEHICSSQWYWHGELSNWPQAWLWALHSATDYYQFWFTHMDLLGRRVEGFCDMQVAALTCTEKSRCSCSHVVAHSLWCFLSQLLYMMTKVERPSSSSSLKTSFCLYAVKVHLQSITVMLFKCCVSATRELLRFVVLSTLMFSFSEQVRIAVVAWPAHPSPCICGWL